MLRSVRVSTAVAFLAFVGSSPAWAYPLSDGSAIWAFEAHGSDSFGGATHTFSGELHVASYGVWITATADGSPSLFLSALAMNTVLYNDTPGIGPDLLVGGGAYGLGTVDSTPSFLVRPASPNWGAAMVSPNFVDQDSMAFDAAYPIPSGGWGPPGYAPDIALFETHQLDVFQDQCIDIDTVSYVSYCSQGGGFHRELQVFTITVDRFVDPVPEPGGLALAVFALAVAAALRSLHSASSA